MDTPEQPDGDEQLDEVQGDIDDARRQAQEHGTIPSPEHERTFIDPDGDGDADEGPGLADGLP